MNDKNHHHLSPHAKAAYWATLHTGGSKEFAILNLMNMKGLSSDEASYKEFMRVGSFVTLWGLIQEAKATFSTLLKNDSSGKIFIICSGLASALKGLYDAYAAQFQLDTATKDVIQSELTYVHQAVSFSMKNEDIPQRSYKNQTLPFVFAPSPTEKAALTSSQTILQWMKEAPNAQVLTESSFRHAKAFLALYNEVVPLFEMPLHATEEALTLCQLINTAVIAGLAKSLGVSGIQGCDERKQASHIAFSSAESLDRDLTSLLRAYTSW